MAEMFSFLYSYTAEKKEKLEEEKLNLLRKMKQEKKDLKSVAIVVLEFH